MKRILSLVATAAVSVLFGCADYQEDGEETLGASTYEIEESEVEVGLLAFVNDQAATTFDRLDTDCAIRSDSTENILAHRDGADGTPATTDDDLFDTIQELDDIRMVGPWTLDRLTECAEAYGYMPAEPTGQETSAW
ncbi:MAG: hypothetical protein JRI68_23930, partial [Deltaproteobacteria bacterium]|nr:hypothetical protein [Deltaproteobacteria bacterium]